MNYEIFKMIHNFSGHNQFLDKIMIFFTNYALELFALVLIAMWFFGNTNYKRSVLYAGGTGIIALFINFLITLVYFEPRPFVAHHIHVLLPHVADASFPSDHGTGAFAIAFALWLRHRKIGTAMIICAFLTGFSRIWVGHHYPFDIVGSIIVAILTAVSIIKFSRFIDRPINMILDVYNSIINRLKKSLPQK
ncbi:undecaprenyl-diphosphatase [Heyndrickxia sp. NPDC080065]|uniref:undecaprenyl-diphosphatase n=1 Tax=Heyndrickxia sp. NPDC080065 TaxID=3390568 RepID=UPI003D02E24F